MRQKKTPDPRIKRLIDGFFTILKIRVGEHPVGFNGGAAARGFKFALTTFSEDEIKRRIECWFQSTDVFIVENQFRITLFFQNFNRLQRGPIGDIYARGIDRRGGYIGTEAPVGKYAALEDAKRAKS